MNTDIKSIPKPHELNERVREAFRGLYSQPDLELDAYVCLKVGEWLEYRVTLKGGRSFMLFFGMTRKVLRFCRRMCSTGRKFVQGVVVSMKQSADDIRREIVNCIRSVRTALYHGNKSAIETPEAIENEVDIRNQALPERPVLRLGFRFA